MKTTNRLMMLSVTAALAGWSAGASASAFQLLEQNASGLGNAYSGQAAAAENASTIYYNPAGMTRLPGQQISFSFTAIQPSVKFGNTSSAMPPLVPLGTNGGDAGGWNYLPTGYLSWQINPQLWAGVGVTSPFGLKTEYDAGFIGRFQSQKTQLKTYDINPSVAWKINDVVSLGAGVSYQHANLTQNKSTFGGVVGGAAVVLPTSYDLSDNAWGWNVGAMFAPAPDTRIGVAYRSSMGYNLSGGVNVVGAFATTGTGAVRLPDTLSAGLSQKLTDRWQLLADLTLTRWSSIKTLGLTLANGVASVPVNLQFSGWPMTSHRYPINTVPPYFLTMTVPGLRSAANIRLAKPERLILAMPTCLSRTARLTSYKIPRLSVSQATSLATTRTASIS